MQGYARGPKCKLKLAGTKIGVIVFLRSDFMASDFNVPVKSYIQPNEGTGPRGAEEPRHGTGSRNSLALVCKIRFICHLLRRCLV